MEDNKRPSWMPSMAMMINIMVLLIAIIAITVIFNSSSNMMNSMQSSSVVPPAGGTRGVEGGGYSGLNTMLKNPLSTTPFRG
jgi:ABC-type transport system involved in multi-copper enzyme maturation permease subunit